MFLNCIKSKFKMKLKITIFKRNIGDDVCVGYRISKENSPLSEYIFTRKRPDGYIKVEDSLSLTKNPSYMGTNKEEEANKKLKEVVKKRLEELAKELEASSPILPF